MGARDADCVFVVFHDLPYHDSTFHHREVSLFGFCKLWVIWMDCRSIYNKINIIGNIFGILSIYYMDT